MTFCSFLGDPGAEENAYQRVTNVDAKHVVARLGLGNLYMNLGRYDDAAREFEAAVQSPYATGAVVSQWVTLKIRLLARAGSPGEWHRLEQSLAALAQRFGRGSPEPALNGSESFGYAPREGETDADMAREHARVFRHAITGAGVARSDPSMTGTSAALHIQPQSPGLIDRINQEVS